MQARAVREYPADNEENDMVVKLPRPGAQTTAPAGWGNPPATAPNTFNPPSGGFAPAPADAQAPAAVAPASWGTPAPVAAAPVAAQAPAGWGAPAPEADTAQRAAMQAMLTTGNTEAQIEAQAAAIAATNYDAPAPAGNGWQAPQAATQRERGKPSPGKARRTKEEVAEDVAAGEPGAVAAPQTEVLEAVSDGSTNSAHVAPSGYDSGPGYRMEILKLVFADPNAALEEGLDCAKAMWAFVKGE